MLNWQTTMDSPLNSLTALAVQLQILVTMVVNHPIRTIVIVVLGIVLLQIIADVIKRLVKASLAFALKLPLVLSQWMWQKITTPPAKQAKTLDQLLDQLEALRQEQDQVVSEMKALLAQSQPRRDETLNPVPLPAVSRKKNSEKLSDSTKSTAAQASAKK